MVSRFVAKRELAQSFALLLLWNLSGTLSGQDVVRLDATEAQMQIKRQVSISSEVAGTLVTVNPTEEGISVTKGDMLIKLNDAVIAAEVARARKQSTLTTEIEFAEVALATALEGQTQKREANVRRPGAFTPSEMRQVDLEVRKGEAQLAKSQEDKGLAELDLKIKEAQLSQYTVFAPFDGFVTKVQKYPGQNVRPGDPVLTLTDMSELRASVKVHFKHRDLLFVGDEVEIRIMTQRGAPDRQPAAAPADDSEPIFGDIPTGKKGGPSAAAAFSPLADEISDSEVFVGRIDMIDPKVEPDSTQALMFRLGVTVPNRKDKNGRYMLQEGMPVKAVILAKKR
ncbi:MAG: efflux RND transporter periplasmic adaptor subunit [Planctomycetaceae bacterium]